ncbi:amidophosphoribosyltransferase [Penicillium waksmanii]|uniref:amidophosphoribosyltransferase n=1 Tax=Penicillium waksmanii TaxID=69791 RepID=UPI002547E3EE|nr:amidophosphoribosyltransferase [Penicillium waksmanii]KAJ5980197.1 amidophosphoribosyltransferase [Penicillium waksmanii]
MAPKPVRKSSTADPKDRKLDGKKAMKARASTTRKQPTRDAKSKAKKPALKASQKKTPTKKNIKANVKKEEEEFPQPNLNSPQPPLALHRKPQSPSPKETDPNTKSHQEKPPFDFWPHPTQAQCEEVNQLLSYAHGEPIAPKTIPQASIEFAGCGEVPCVLDAMIRTLLSAATLGSNSAMSYKALASRFGVLEEGVGQGGVNWEAVRQAPLREVYDTIRRGGLADIKSKSLKGILDMVYEENRMRVSNEGGEDSNDITTLTEPEPEPGTKTDKSKSDEDKEREYNLACAEQNYLTLNHLHNLPTPEAMEELIKYPGIGVKTAACVLLFCLQRPCFAVDTHIFRITKWLGWVPADLATEVTAFSHLDARIPDHLKYSLHHLLIKHGKLCPRCRASTGVNSEEWELGCPIEDLLTRTGKRKGGPEIVSRGSKRGRSAAVKKVATKRKGVVKKKVAKI